MRALLALALAGCSGFTSAAEVLRLAVTPSGRVIVTGKQPSDTIDSATATVSQMVILPGGGVDLALDIHWTRVDMQLQSHARVLGARLIATCP